jgi:hypothetical protein
MFWFVKIRDLVASRAADRTRWAKADARPRKVLEKPESKRKGISNEEWWWMKQEKRMECESGKHDAREERRAQTSKNQK